MKESFTINKKQRIKNNTRLLLKIINDLHELGKITSNRDFVRKYLLPCKDSSYVAGLIYKNREPSVRVLNHLVIKLKQENILLNQIKLLQKSINSKTNEGKNDRN